MCTVIHACTPLPPPEAINRYTKCSSVPMAGLLPVHLVCVWGGGGWQRGYVCYPAIVIIKVISLDNLKVVLNIKKTLVADHIQLHVQASPTFI
jgi:hypothetical protein